VTQLQAPTLIGCNLLKNIPQSAPFPAFRCVCRLVVSSEESNSVSVFCVCQHFAKKFFESLQQRFQPATNFIRISQHPAAPTSSLHHPENLSPSSEALHYSKVLRRRASTECKEAKKASLALRQPLKPSKRPVPGAVHSLL
jgi:hypothetical protein